MYIGSIINRADLSDNSYFNKGDIAQQIIVDFEILLEKLNRHQTEHLDKVCKGKIHHYDEWTKENQELILYIETLLNLVKLGANKK